jgi:hypothetical protein
MSIIELKLRLPDAVLDWLSEEAQRRETSLENVISDVLTDYLEEPTEEQILANLKSSMQQALSGDVRSAQAMLNEITHDPNYT